MRNKVLVAALVLVGLASVAYAAFAQTLTINGNGNTTGTWDVAITNITLSSATGATNNTAPTYNATSATFDANLAYPGATATYDVTITNNGSVDAILSSITPADFVSLNGTAPTYITYSMSGVTAGSTTLAAGATNHALVTVTWDAANATSGAASKPATITFNYAQNT